MSGILSEREATSSSFGRLITEKGIKGQGSTMAGSLSGDDPMKSVAIEARPTDKAINTLNYCFKRGNSRQANSISFIKLKPVTEEPHSPCAKVQKIRSISVSSMSDLMKRSHTRASSIDVPRVVLNKRGSGETEPGLSNQSNRLFPIFNEEGIQTPGKSQAQPLKHGHSISNNLNISKDLPEAEQSKNFNGESCHPLQKSLDLSQQNPASSREDNTWHRIKRSSHSASLPANSDKFVVVAKRKMPIMKINLKNKFIDESKIKSGFCNNNKPALKLNSGEENNKITRAPEEKAVFGGCQTCGDTNPLGSKGALQDDSLEIRLVNNSQEKEPNLLEQYSSPCPKFTKNIRSSLRQNESKVYNCSRIIRSELDQVGSNMNSILKSHKGFLKLRKEDIQNGESSINNNQFKETQRFETQLRPQFQTFQASAGLGRDIDPKIKENQESRKTLAARPNLSKVPTCLMSRRISSKNVCSKEKNERVVSAAVPLNSQDVANCSQNVLFKSTLDSSKLGLDNTDSFSVLSRTVFKGNQKSIPRLSNFVKDNTNKADKVQLCEEPNSYLESANLRKSSQSPQNKGQNDQSYPSVEIQKEPSKQVLAKSQSLQRASSIKTLLTSNLAHPIIISKDSFNSLNQTASNKSILKNPHRARPSKSKYAKYFLVDQSPAQSHRALSGLSAHLFKDKPQSDKKTKRIEAAHRADKKDWELYQIEQDKKEKIRKKEELRNIQESPSGSPDLKKSVRFARNRIEIYE